MHVFEKEERALRPKTRHDVTLSAVMHNTWETKGAWFRHCISSVNAMYLLLESQLCPPGSLSSETEAAVSTFWCWDAEDAVPKKLADKEAYDSELRKLFED